MGSGENITSSGFSVLYLEPGENITSPGSSSDYPEPGENIPKKTKLLLLVRFLYFRTFSKSTHFRSMETKKMSAAQ